MSMSTTVIGFAPPDEKWRKMKTIYDACCDANIDVPEEVDAFFGGCPPDDAGVEIKLPIVEWKNDYAQGYELEVAKIPMHVKTIRFFNAW